MWNLQMIVVRIAILALLVGDESRISSSQLLQDEDGFWSRVTDETSGEIGDWKDVLGIIRDIARTVVDEANKLTPHQREADRIPNLRDDSTLNFGKTESENKNLKQDYQAVDKAKNDKKKSLDDLRGKPLVQQHRSKPALLNYTEKDYYTQFDYPMNVDLLPLVKKLRSGTPADQLSVTPINTFSFTFLKTSKNKCQGTKDGPHIVLLIKSALPNIERRLAIRQTWGNEKQFSNVTIRRVFLIGKSSDDHILQNKLDEEYSKYEDLVQADFIDSYKNLTLKTMSGLKWAVERCSRARYFAFIDDDMFISTINLLRFLRNPSSYPDDNKAVGSEKFGDELRLYAGDIYKNTRPLRDSSSKWYIPLSDYAFNYWPPYAAGGAYVLSRSALFDLHYGSMFTERIFIEDAFLGIVAKKVRIDPVHCPGFNVHGKTPYSEHDSADSFRNIIASHGYNDPEELKRTWYQQKKLGYA